MDIGFNAPTTGGLIEPDSLCRIVAEGEALGRLTLGIGVGWCREEFDAIAAAPFDDRGHVTDESMMACKELWFKGRSALRRQVRQVQ
jgi:hypothetical protein